MPDSLSHKLLGNFCYLEQLYMPAQEEPLTNVLELMGTTKRTFQTVKVMFMTHETILKDDF